MQGVKGELQLLPSLPLLDTKAVVARAAPMKRVNCAATTIETTLLIDFIIPLILLFIEPFNAGRMTKLGRWRKRSEQ
jgi:hypothetical protein